MLSKKQPTGQNVKLQYITSAIIAKWPLSQIEVKTQITDGKISLKGNTPFREKPKEADYVLYARDNYPIAVVEAKDNNHTISFDLQQAMVYAAMLDVPFAYISDGDGFYEHNLLTGAERQIALDEFPSPAELIARYESGANGGQGLNANERKIQEQPYYSSQKTYAPRYYQRNAINRTVGAVARGQDRLLLVMATGTGKTYTAFQIVYRLLKSGLKKKILYLADRNILVDQSIQQDFAPLEKTIHKINFAKDDPTTVTSYEVFFSLYQQLSDRDDDGGNLTALSRLTTLFRPKFFDLIIVDECHRGSAKKDSSWRKILEYFSSATQIGMTATPKETKYTSNVDYFGKPVYTYSLREGIEDGFLAPFKVINISTNIGNGWRPSKGQCDKNGNLIEDRVYTDIDFDYNIILEDRTEDVAQEITKYLKSTNRMQKTIVFCATEEHAERMRTALSKLNQDMVQKNPDYVVRITGTDTYGKSKLDYFISVTSSYPVIATTSKLLSTGVDCKMTKLIVLDQMISSMTEFKQIIGRGTRIREKEGKMSFTVIDFRNVTQLFADPEWDGPIEQKKGCGKASNFKRSNSDSKTSATVWKNIVDKNGCSVNVIGTSVSVYDTDGKLLREENIVDYTKSNILSYYADLDSFTNSWSSEEKKESIRSLFLANGIDLEAVKADKNMSDVDDFDFIRHLAYDKKPLTRKERAENVKKRGFLSKYNGVAHDVLKALLEQYIDTGIYEIEKTEVLKLDKFIKYGPPAKIAEHFSGKSAYLKVIRELEEELYREEC